MSLKTNMSIIDRVIRFFVGAILAYLGFFYENLTDYTLINIFIGVFGVINVISAIISSCPVYTIAGISSCKKPHDD